jgi:hypothetical protein
VISSGFLFLCRGGKKWGIRTPPEKRYQDFSMWGHKDSSRKERGSLLMAMSLLMKRKWVIRTPPTEKRGSLLMTIDKLPRYV